MIFSGANDYACDVFGYGGVDSTTESDATLEFADYSGTLSGGVGGFESVALSGDTQLRLAPAAGRSVTENAWSFDVTERAAAYENSAFLDWSGSFGAVDLKLTVGAENDVAWTLVSGVESYKADGFAVEIAGGGTYYLDFDAATGRTGTLGGAGCSGALATWGFALEDTVLKFRNLA